MKQQLRLDARAQPDDQAAPAAVIPAPRTRRPRSTRAARRAGARPRRSSRSATAARRSASSSAADRAPARSKTVAVPNLVGLRSDEAVERLRDAGLCPSLEPAPADADDDIGVVVDQLPTAGSEVPRSDVVDVFVGSAATLSADNSQWFAAAAPAPAPPPAEVPLTDPAPRGEAAEQLVSEATEPASEVNEEPEQAADRAPAEPRSRPTRSRQDTLRRRRRVLVTLAVAVALIWVAGLAIPLLRAGSETVRGQPAAPAPPASSRAAPPRPVRPRTARPRAVRGEPRAARPHAARARRERRGPSSEAAPPAVPAPAPRAARTAPPVATPSAPAPSPSPAVSVPPRAGCEACAEVSPVEIRP